MKSTEPTWFKKYRDDYLRVEDTLLKSRVEDLVSKMEWFDDKVISKSQGNSYHLLRNVSFQNRYGSTEGDLRRVKLFFHKIKNSKYPNIERLPEVFNTKWILRILFLWKYNKRWFIGKNVWYK